MQARMVRAIRRLSVYQRGKSRRKAEIRVADRARLLAARVPENRWADVEWFEDEE